MRLLIDFKYQLVQELVCAPANIVFLVYSFLDFVFIIIYINILCTLHQHMYPFADYKFRFTGFAEHLQKKTFKQYNTQWC